MSAPGAGFALSRGLEGTGRDTEAVAALGMCAGQANRTSSLLQAPKGPGWLDYNPPQFCLLQSFIECISCKATDIGNKPVLPSGVTSSPVDGYGWRIFVQTIECGKTDRFKNKRTAGQRKTSPSPRGLTSAGHLSLSVCPRECPTYCHLVTGDRTNLPAGFLLPFLMGVEGQARSQMGPGVSVV